MIEPTNVYLAGGFKSGWQDTVMRSCEDLFREGIVTWSDPRKNNTNDPYEYGPMDRRMMDKTDMHITFGFAEKSNPLPFPLFFEMGYALGKQCVTVIFVNEIPEDDPRWRPMLFPKVFGCGQILTAPDLDEGIKTLRMMLTAHAKHQGWNGKVEMP